MYKQVILVRQDLKMPKGKLSAQVAHASVDGLLKSHKDDILKWKAEGMKKIVLKVKDKKELFEYRSKADEAGVVSSVIQDAGLTVFKKPTITCMSIGPDKEEKIDKITGKLKIL